MDSAKAKAIQATDIGSDCREYAIRRFIEAKYQETTALDAIDRPLDLFCTFCKPAGDGLCDRALVAIGYPSSHVSN
jgi:hypothetical protein